MLTVKGLGLERDGFALSADFTVTGPGVVAVIGPSGGGKSTLLDAIGGFVTPAQGEILWQGDRITGLPPAARPVSCLFQDGNLFPHLSAAQNVGLGLRPGLRLDEGERTCVAGALAAVGLEGFGARKPGALSGGQQSRVALARVLVAARPLVLLDEPFAALGPALKAEMLGLVRDLLAGQGKTVLMVTHDPADAKAVADQVIVVAEGRAQPPVGTAALFADPPAVLRAYLGSAGD